MIRVAIVDSAGKIVLPKDLSTAAELREAAEQARELIKQCEQVARQKDPKAPTARQGGTPYLS
jgi:hypothetical protein